jgi:5-methylcytosine-specific restriction protein A
MQRKNQRQSSLPPHVAKFYSTARWRRRRDHQLATEPRCVVCLKAGQLTVATVADHIERATDAQSFWQGPLQSLCAPHHQSKRQAEATGNEFRPKMGCDASGWPRDPQHEWNR